ncbi:hypothetical protein [Thalassobaculum litoreum]|uniref:Uncharacterized protein n=1 Tax=Thalassobaculum litoreum DSM 18839 TaxID=1123362 RepID=A0A8G2BHH8_9PROT|nr:hypothetical protein [Thalassobaculum litoreum]SDF32226.1 hypothetical protein SAMN05660686_01038 [Thalassobaculum litoreum DSM 18839]
MKCLAGVVLGLMIGSAAVATAQFSGRFSRNVTQLNADDIEQIMETALEACSVGLTGAISCK